MGGRRFDELSSWFLCRIALASYWYHNICIYLATCKGACPYMHLVASYVPEKVRQMRPDCAKFYIFSEFTNALYSKVFIIRMHWLALRFLLAVIWLTVYRWLHIHGKSTFASRMLAILLSNFNHIKKYPGKCIYLAPCKASLRSIDLVASQVPT